MLSTIAVAMTGISVAKAAPTIGLNEADMPTKYIVKFKENLPSPLMRTVNGVFMSQSELRQSLLKNIKARDIEKVGNEATYSVEVDENDLPTLQNSGQVEYVEIDPPRYLLSETTPWGLSNVSALLVSDSNAGNRTVCIVDSGYDLGHSDLPSNTVSGTNDSGTGDWYKPGANNTHGTHVAGTIAALENGIGVKGVMPSEQANLHIVKVFNSSGWGYSSSLVNAVQTCADNGANVVNMSLGGSQASFTERRAMKALYDQGVLLVAAAGNDGTTAYSYPASYSSVMSVAATDSNNQHANFSQQNSQVEISAPGEAILSTVTRGEGVTSDITLGGKSYFDRGVVPHNRLVVSSNQYVEAPIAGTVTGAIATCNVTSGQYNCPDMSGKICLTERAENQSSGVYPESDAVQACYNAGAKAAIVYSNSSRPGLQNPFLLDPSDNYGIVSVSVDRQLGLELEGLAGSNATVSTKTGRDYAYMNGTSMASPHVAGVAALVWSYNPTCTAEQVRSVLDSTASGYPDRSVNTGYGIINALAAKEKLASGCN